MSFFIGLDLGQIQDYTALTVVEFKQRTHVGAKERADHHCRYLRRWPLGTTYPAICEDIKQMLMRLNDSRLVVDATGVGRPVVDLLREFNLQPTSVTITSGTASGSDGYGGYTVPKRELISNLQVLLQTNHLKFAADMPEVQTLLDELLSFQVKTTIVGHDIYEAWREGKHDDLVLALALACWYGEHHGYVYQPLPPRHKLPQCIG
ncbi:MAG TPA: hypothetical protein VGK87_00050 [Anaerolineae bacterium]|jgi:hypothetical protein